MSADVVHPLNNDNFIKHKLVIQAERNWKNCVLLYDGDVVIKRLGSATVKDDNGKDTVVVLSCNFIHCAYFVKIDDQTMYLAPQFKWYELAWLWITLPLVFIGGAVGGGLIALTIIVNSNLYRKLYSANAFIRYLATGVVSLLVCELYFGLGTFVYCWLSPGKCQHF